jgi:hypothetical protein
MAQAATLSESTLAVAGGTAGLARRSRPGPVPSGASIRPGADNLQPASASLFHAAGVTICTPALGGPYVDAGVRRPLGHNERKDVQLEFVNPSGAPISYLPRVLAGPGPR